MTTLQKKAIGPGATLTLTPSVLVMVWTLWFDGKSPSRYPSEILAIVWHSICRIARNASTILSPVLKPWRQGCA
jgi:hypothetical protein